MRGLARFAAAKTCKRRLVCQLFAAARNLKKEEIPLFNSPGPGVAWPLLHLGPPVRSDSKMIRFVGVTRRADCTSDLPWKKMACVTGTEGSACALDS